MSSCRRTTAIVERSLDDALTAHDRRHLGVCAKCSRALPGAPAFASALALASRSLATERLPAGVLTVAGPADNVSMPAGRLAWVASVAGGALVVSALVVALAIVGGRIGPQPGAEAGAGLRDEAAIVADLGAASYICSDAVLGPLVSPPRVGTLCRIFVLAGDIDAGAALARQTGGGVAEMTVKAVVGRSDDPQAHGRVHALLLDTVRLAFISPAEGDAAATWLDGALSGLPPSGAQAGHVGGVDLTIERLGDDGYLLRLSPAEAR